ncbi:MAG: alcohol dehydrogenase catalytic domain-containing protein [Pirellulales bacterium]|nr:alcohol dehydrogenase catalytic domain-containing protein [Pirellulales bacterium]
MKAACLNSIGAPLALEEVPEPTLERDEVLVETRACGICRTDIHIQDGLAYVPRLPHIPGHEPAGLVCAVGAQVGSPQIGDRVVPHLFLTCGECIYCRTGRDAQCSRGRGIIGVTTGGGFAEYFKAPARNLLLLPDEVPFEAGGLVSCAVVTAVRAYRRAQVQLADPVLVLGVGGIGQILIQLLKHAGARVAALSRSQASLQIAARLGAELCLQAGAEAIPEIIQFADGEGVACAVECVGLGTTMALAAKCTRRGGRIVVVGEEAEFPAVDTIQIAQRELEIVGSRNGSKQDAQDALRWMASGVIQPPIAERVPLDRINDGLDMVRHGRVHGRVVVKVRGD